MWVYLMRHGIAAARGDPAFRNDADRPLTREGHEKTARCARGLRALGIEPDVILSSPLTRARQTAELVAAELGIPATRLRITPALEPAAPPDAVIAEINASGALASVMLVGHEPDLSGLASYLLSGDEHSIDLTLKKGAVCAIEMERVRRGEPGTLAFLLQPGQLRKMAK